MNQYYVYSHKKPCGEVFYIGKGLRNRFINTGNRSIFWKRIANKYGYVPEIIISGLTEEEAYKKEIELISYYRSIGQCCANMSDGGDGVRVKNRWWGMKISESLKRIGYGKNKRGKDSPSYLDVISKEALEDLYVNKGFSSTYIGEKFGISYTTVISRLRYFGLHVRPLGIQSKRIVCLTDGKKFNSITGAAVHYDIFRENIRKVLSGKYKTTGGRSFAYITDDK